MEPRSPGFLRSVVKKIILRFRTSLVASNTEAAEGSIKSNDTFSLSHSRTVRYDKVAAAIWAVNKE